MDKKTIWGGVSVVVKLPLDGRKPIEIISKNSKSAERVITELKNVLNKNRNKRTELVNAIVSHSRRFGNGLPEVKMEDIIASSLLNIAEKLNLKPTITKKIVDCVELNNNRYINQLKLELINSKSGKPDNFQIIENYEKGKLAILDSLA